MCFYFCWSYLFHDQQNIIESTPSKNYQTFVPSFIEAKILCFTVDGKIVVQEKNNNNNHLVYLFDFDLSSINPYKLKKLNNLYYNHPITLYWMDIISHDILSLYQNFRKCKIVLDDKSSISDKLLHHI